MPKIPHSVSSLADNRLPRIERTSNTEPALSHTEHLHCPHRSLLDLFLTGFEAV